ncbi:MAG TPA: hypothetical protein VMW58_06990 [Anaerolineae bacterium]|nr:hypothetical protein [Anaerolineae bacterium]
MDFQEIASWLVSEAGAGWAAALFVVIVAVIGWIAGWRRRERPPLVVVEEMKNIRLLDIHPSQRERLTVSYLVEEGMQIPIEDLRQKDIVIYNNGTSDIVDPVQIELRVVRAGSDQVPFQGFWEWFSDDKRFASTVVKEEVSERVGSSELKAFMWRGVHIELPYLNSYPVHRDCVRAHIVCDGEVEMALWGTETGRGWSARFISLERARLVQRRVGMGVAGAAFLLILLGLLCMKRTVGSPYPILRVITATIFAVGVGLLYLDRPVARVICRRILQARLPSDFIPTKA